MTWCTNMRSFVLMQTILFLNFLASSNSLLRAQQYQDYQLRLEPVWSRVADSLGELGSVESAEFSPDGRHIVSGAKFDNSVIMWRTSDGHELWRRYTEQEIERVGWSSDNRFVAACSEDYRVTVFNSANGKIEKTIELKKGIDGLTWSHEGSTLLVGEEETVRKHGPKQGFIRAYQMPEADLFQTVDFGGTVNELLFSRDDRYVVASGHGAVKVYRTDDWSLQAALQPPQAKFVAGSFSPDARLVFAGDNQGYLYLWDWKNDKLLRRLNHTGKKVETVAYHPSGNYVAFAGHDPYIRVYRVDDIVNYKPERIRVAHQVWAGDHAEYIDFNRDGSFLVSAHQNGLIKLWVWMGEDPALNDKRHSEVSKTQSDAVSKQAQDE